MQVTELTTDPTELTLDVNLEPRMARGNRIASTWLLGLLLAAITGVLAWVLTLENGWEIRLGMAVAAVIIGLLAALLLWSGLQQTLALSIPHTIVEIERQPVTAGETIRLCVKQPGPVRLRSLRANLVGLQRTEQKRAFADGARQTRSPDSMLCHQNLLDAGGGRIPAGQCRQWITTFEVPGEAPASGKEKAVVTNWTIEVWGKACFGMIGFHYQFPIKLRVAAG